MEYKSERITATTLPDAWFRTVYRCVEIGRDFQIDRGSFEGDKRLEFDMVEVEINYPGYPDPDKRISEEQLLPEIPQQYNLPNPVEKGYLADYLPYLLTGELKPGESYTYGQRLNAYPIPGNWVNGYDSPRLKDILIQEPEAWKAAVTETSEGWVLNQVELLKWTYANKGHRNNQMVLQIAHPADMLLKDPPCLRQIQTRIQDGTLHFIVYFRSWDLWSGFPANLAAIQLLKEMIADELGVKDGKIMAYCAGLHLYSYVWELAEIIRGKSIEAFANMGL